MQKPHFGMYVRGNPFTFFLLPFVIILVIASVSIFHARHPQKNINAKIAVCDLTVGDIVPIDESGTSYEYVMVKKTDKAVHFMRKNVIGQRLAFDDESSLYEESNLDKFLSEDFMNRFSEKIKEYIIYDDIRVSRPEIYQGEETDGTYSIRRMAYAPSYTEVGYSESHIANQEGMDYGLFAKDADRIAADNDQAAGYWLRTPYIGYKTVAWSVGPSGIKTELSIFENCGVRPVICVDPNTPITSLNNSNTEKR